MGTPQPRYPETGIILHYSPILGVASPSFPDKGKWLLNEAARECEYQRASILLIHDLASGDELNNRNQQRLRCGIITGAGSGLGRVLSHRLARDGYELAVTDIDADRLQQVAREIQAWSPNSFAQPLDVSDADAWNSILTTVESRWGRLDLLVNSAGTLAVGDFMAIPPDQAKRVIEVNLLGVIHGCQACGSLLMASGEGVRIINVASCAGFLTFPWSSSYNAAKAGVLAYSECLANELAESSVSITVACPGFFSSPLVDSAHYSDPVLEQCARRVFERSNLTIDGVAEAILRASARGRLHVMVPFRVRWMWWCKRFFPAQLMRSVRRTSRRLRNRYANESVSA